MKVLFVIPGQRQGSSMIFVQRQAESLRREGIEVHSFYLRSRTSLRALVREADRFRGELRRLRPDLVHAHFGTMTAMFAALAAAGTPLVITYRGGDLNRGQGMRPALGRVLSQLAALRARRIVCVSRQLRERLWWRRARVAVLPSGVDKHQFRPQPREAARWALGWDLHDRVVLFNAGHDPCNKRLDLAVAAVARAPGLRLEVLDGEVDPERVPVIMNASDCLLVTSDREGSPTVVQEALACGLPVVSVDVGDVAERLEGICHTRIVPREPGEIAAALVELTARPVRTNGPERCQDISLDRIARRLCEIYCEAIGMNPEPARKGLETRGCAN